MEDIRRMKIDDLRSRIARADYDVDADAVAVAFLKRMLVVHRALRRVDVRELLGDAGDELGPSAAQNSCS
jgi:hypothetical protein